MNKCRYHPARLYWKVPKQITNKALQLKNCDNLVEYIWALQSKDSTVVFTQNYVLCTSKDVCFKIGFAHSEPDECFLGGRGCTCVYSLIRDT